MLATTLYTPEQGPNIIFGDEDLAAAGVVVGHVGFPETPDSTFRRVPLGVDGLQSFAAVAAGRFLGPAGARRGLGPHRADRLRRRAGDHPRDPLRRRLERGVLPAGRAGQGGRRRHHQARPRRHPSDPLRRRADVRARDQRERHRHVHRRRAAVGRAGLARRAADRPARGPGRGRRAAGRRVDHARRGPGRGRPVPGGRAARLLRRDRRRRDGAPARARARHGGWDRRQLRRRRPPAASPARRSSSASCRPAWWSR